MSEKHTSACKTPKPPKWRLEETIKKTSNIAIRGKKMKREGGGPFFPVFFLVFFLRRLEFFERVI